MEETFTLLPIQVDPQSKTPSCPSMPDLNSHFAKLHSLHRNLLSLPSETHATPPPPVPIAPARSAQIQKMREQGNNMLRKASPSSPGPAEEAIKLYGFGIKMALDRPLWEPAGLVKDEASLLFANRSQAHMTVGHWPEGAADAETSVEMKRTANGKAWWRRGKCLMEMGRWHEAREWVKEGCGIEGNDGELGSLGREIEAHFHKEA